MASARSRSMFSNRRSLLWISFERRSRRWSLSSSMTGVASLPRSFKADLRNVVDCFSGGFLFTAGRISLDRRSFFSLAAFRRSAVFWMSICVRVALSRDLFITLVDLVLSFALVCFDSIRGRDISSRRYLENMSSCSIIRRSNSEFSSCILLSFASEVRRFISRRLSLYFWEQASSIDMHRISSTLSVSSSFPGLRPRFERDE
mmetsp:Transcript_6689/g.13312  ORF Transcript_6689/g.13312 Transcript_6689/m.13312 type:complete len:203 (+) Transcript_6689:522-1130(+)